jgi:agmatine deiminase
LDRTIVSNQKAKLFHNKQELFMSSRRNFLKQALSLSMLGTSMAYGASVLKDGTSQTVTMQKLIKTMLLMPSEGAHHAATWMAYGATVSAWGDSTEDNISHDLSNSRTVARQDLMRMAANLSRFEPVFMLVANRHDEMQAKQFLQDVIDQKHAKDQFHSELDNSGRIYLGKNKKGSDLPTINTYPITFLSQHINDLWTRDTAPVFSIGADGNLYGINLNFNGWGQSPISTGLAGWTKDPEKTANGVIDQAIEGDVLVASFINKHIDVKEVSTWLTMEGGGLEVNGHGLAIATESCIINDNRNPGKSKTEIEAELRRLFGIEQMLWMPGVKGVELTDWHIDFTARFPSQSDLLYAFDHKFEPKDKRNEKAMFKEVDRINALSSAQKEVYLGSSEATLKTHAMPVPRIEYVYESMKLKERNSLSITHRDLQEFSDTTAPGYIGFYEANNCILLPQFGDLENDLKAFDIAQNLYPEHIIIQISTDGLCSGGGTIHCATQQQPKV